MKTKHTPEPWSPTGVTEEPAGGGRGLYKRGILSPLPFPANIPYAAVAHGNTKAEAEANAKRIVACVNACKGINPEAVPELLDACESAKKALNPRESWSAEDAAVAYKLVCEALRLAREGE